MHTSISVVLQMLSVVTGLAAAVLWFRASIVSTPGALRHLIHITVGGEIEGDIADLARGVAKQKGLNSFAALFAAASAVLQAIVMVISVGHPPGG
jgi:hypothetical protein